MYHSFLHHLIVIQSRILLPVPRAYITVHGIMAQQQSSVEQHDCFGALTMLAIVEEAGLEPAGGILRICLADWM